MKCGVLRTFGGMSTRHEQYLQSGGHLANAQKHANCIQPFLIEEEPSMQVLEIFPPAQLHLMLGGVNALLNVLTNMFTFEKIETWLNANGVIIHGYQGGSRRQQLKAPFGQSRRSSAILTCVHVNMCMLSFIFRFFYF